MVLFYLILKDWASLDTTLTPVDLHMARDLKKKEFSDVALIWKREL
jgi:hypothetical protein